MQRLGLLALALATAAVIEVAVLFAVAARIGAGWTLLAQLATTMLGGWLLRREGARAWRRLRWAAESGRPPGGEVSHGLLGLLAAGLLALPGFLTDLVGAALLVPPVRRSAAWLVARSAERRMSATLAANLFGPRRVRVRVGQMTAPGPNWSGRADAPAGGRGRDGGHEPVIEGEIVE